MVVVNWNVISNFGWSGNESLIFNRNSQIVRNGVRVLGSDSWSGDGIIFRKSWFRLFKVDLEVSFVNIRSDNILFVVNISWSLYGFFSIFILNNRLSFDWFGIINVVLSSNEFDLKIFFFNNWLDNWLVNIFIGWERNVLNVDIVFNFNRFVEWGQNFFVFSSLFDLELFGDFVYARLDNCLIVNLVTWNVNISNSLFRRVLGWENSSLSFNNLVILLNELWDQLFDLLVNSWLNNNSLSKRFDNLIGYYFRFTNNSFGNNLRISRVSLSNDLWFN